MTKDQKRQIANAKRRYNTALRKAGEQRDLLVTELAFAHSKGATYQELGDLLGVSRQRVHQILTERG